MIFTLHARIVLAVTTLPIVITLAGVFSDVLPGGNGAQGKDDFPKKGSGDSKALASNVNWDFPRTATEYVKLIEPELGVPPKIDLAQSVEIPLFVNGQRSYGNLGQRLDNPTRLGKNTVSGSTLQRYEGRDAAGKPLPDVVWVSFSRNSSLDVDHVLGSVQMIGYNRKTGATAFFESNDQIGPWVRLEPKTWRMVGKMPWIDNPAEFNDAFRVPDVTRPQCVQCHQADPFINSTFINAAKIPGTNEPVVPILDQKSPFYVIGGQKWDMRTVHIDGNKCLTCHRVGLSTISMFMANRWEPNKHMPPKNPGSMAADLEQLLLVGENGIGAVKGAKWILPPAKGEAAPQVGDDYPYQASFNLPWSRQLKKK